MTDLEARIARLERQSTLWKLVAIGVSLVSGALVMNACSAKAAPAEPTSLRFQNADGEVTVDANGITLHKADSQVTIDANQMRIGHGKREVTVSTDRITLGDDTGTATLEAQQFALEAKNQRIETKLNPNGPTTKLTNGNQEVQLVAYDTISSVTATATIPSPTESITAGLYATAGSASFQASRIGEQKIVGVEKPKPAK